MNKRLAFQISRFSALFGTHWHLFFFNRILFFFITVHDFILGIDLISFIRTRVIKDLLPLWLFNGRVWWVVTLEDSQSLLFGCLALFIKVHIDRSHLAVHLFFLLELLTAFILQKLSLSTRGAINSDSYVTFIFRLHFKVTLWGQERVHRYYFKARRQNDWVEICSLVHSDVTTSCRDSHLVPLLCWLFLWIIDTFCLKAWEKGVCRATTRIFLTRGSWRSRFFRFLVRVNDATAVLSNFDIASSRMHLRGSRYNLSWRILTHIGSSHRLTVDFLIVDTVASRVWWARQRILSLKRSFISLCRLAVISDVGPTTNFHFILLA